MSCGSQLNRAPNNEGNTSRTIASDAVLVSNFPFGRDIRHVEGEEAPTPNGPAADPYHQLVTVPLSAEPKEAIPNTLIPPTAAAALVRIIQYPTLHAIGLYFSTNNAAQLALLHINGLGSACDDMQLPLKAVIVPSGMLVLEDDNGNGPRDKDASSPPPPSVRTMCASTSDPRRTLLLEDPRMAWARCTLPRMEGFAKVILTDWSTAIGHLMMAQRQKRQQGPTRHVMVGRGGTKRERDDDGRPGGMTPNSGPLLTATTNPTMPPPAGPMATVDVVLALPSEAIVRCVEGGCAPHYRGSPVGTKSSHVCDEEEEVLMITFKTHQTAVAAYNAMTGAGAMVAHLV